MNVSDNAPSHLIAPSRRQRQTVFQQGVRPSQMVSTLAPPIHILQQADAKEISIQVKLFETTDAITEFKCMDNQTVKHLFQELIVKEHLMGGGDKVSQSQASQAAITNMYSLLLVQQNVVQQGRWIVNLDMPLRQLILTSKSVIHCISKSKKMNVVVSDTKQLQITLDETLPVQQLTQEIAKKLTIKQTFADDFSLRYIPKCQADKPFIMINNNAECRWLDPNLTLREQGFDFTNDKIAFSRKYHFYFDEMLKNAEMFYEAISVTFIEARSRYLAGEFETDKLEDVMSNDTLELLSVEAIGSGQTVFKDDKMLKLLIPANSLKKYESNKAFSKSKKDLEKLVQTKSAKFNENLAQTKFLEQISQSPMYKLNLFCATTKQGNADTEILLGIGLNEVCIISKAKGILLKFDLDEVTHFAGSEVSFHMITLVRGKQSKTDFETRQGKQIESTLNHVSNLYRNHKKVVMKVESTPLPNSVPTKNFELLLRDFDLVKKAQDELFDLERRMFNTGPLRGYDEFTYDKESVHPLPNVNSIETEIMKQFIEVEAETRSLTLQKSILKNYLDSTRVGTYEQSVPAMQKQVDSILQQMEQYGTEKDIQEVRMMAQDIKQSIHTQLSSFVNYENYLHSKYELLMRKREHVLNTYDVKMKEEKKDNYLPAAASSVVAKSSTVRASMDVSKMLKDRKDLGELLGTSTSPQRSSKDIRSSTTFLKPT